MYVLTSTGIERMASFSANSDVGISTTKIRHMYECDNNIRESDGAG